MKKDLTKVPGSISYEYLQVMPTIYALQADDKLTAQEKRDEVLVVAIQALNKATTNKTSTYERKRNELFNAKTDAEIVRVMQETIINGQNYEDGRN